MNIDQNRIAADIMRVLSRYDINYNADIVREKIVPTWYQRKLPLLERLSKHPNWDDDAVGVLFNTRYERNIDCNDARYYARQIVRIYYDHSGGVFPPSVGERLNWDYGLYRESKITTETYKAWAELCPPDKEARRFFPVGLRASKAFDRLFKYYGLDQYDWYNQLFAPLADSVSPLSVDRTCCLSLHPCDYLLMSHGAGVPGWKSCHRIDGGEWQGGTWSYMLDDTSCIFHTTDPADTDMPTWARPKINRMVTCLGNNEILFSRLYPDYGDVRLRKTFRQLIQELYAKCLDIPNLWQSPLHYSEYTDLDLVHNGEGYMQYPDYHYSEYNVELSVAKDCEPEELEIGAYGICPVTGREYSRCRHMTDEIVRHCAHCGCTIDDDDEYREYNGRYYCPECFEEEFEECAECGEWMPRDDMYHTNEDGWVCEHCFHASYYICERCGDAVRETEVVFDHDGTPYCEWCADMVLSCCDNCGEMFHCDDITEHNDRYLCPDCLEAARAEEEEEVQAHA